MTERNQERYQGKQMIQKHTRFDNIKADVACGDQYRRKGRSSLRQPDCVNP